MNLEFTVTEAIVHSLGVINEIRYEFEEFTVEYVSAGITNKKEKRSRTYDTNITRKEYNKLAEQYHYGLSFDNFIVVLRPFMMGFYQNDELEQAFRILDKNNSDSIDVDDLANFLPIINEYATSDTLKNYIKKSDFNFDENLSYDEFRSLILKGIGRDMICTHI
ncbi:unnamed protein product [Rotaria socialis]|uniref:EF-hand domain-containing protein n=1 Tax=Rotaria socialis TaxID=392032 RepID=A0A820ZPY1_9BILA|nr:unnamed protein product [Rotaria socialis]CAF3401003.1 unnamed protein product [Rotaria socialis]CAF3517112.1 unnamed protein product [Rotaria socialis]CAF3611939.1 unnamed protein product [Rotaria socialis]CAF3619334.1 unnamed protein product [Rotaria socialis]